MNELIGKKVMILSSFKSRRTYQRTIGKIGVIKQTFCGNLKDGQIAIKFDDIKNTQSKNGYFWYRQNEYKILEGNHMKELKGFNYVAVVELFEDVNKKEYGFALYDSELSLICDEELNLKRDTMVVVNSLYETNKCLGYVLRVVPLNDFLAENKNRGRKITAQIVGIVNTDGYDARVAEEKRQEEIQKQIVAIDKRVQDIIKEKQTITLYEDMVKMYPEDMELQQLVNTLKELKGVSA